MDALRLIAESRGFTSIACLSLGHNHSGSAPKRLYQRTPRERIEKAWDFEEPDRVPFELYIMPAVKDNLLCARVIDLIEEHADNWSGWGPSWGWFGLDIEDEEEMLEEHAGRYHRKRTIRHTSAGDFTQVTWHPVSTIDYHYEKHFISTLDDLDRLTRAQRKTISGEGFRREKFGDRFVTTSLPHPFGQLARHTDQTTCYSWFVTEPEALHEFFSSYTDMHKGVPKWRPPFSVGVDIWFIPSIFNIDRADTIFN